MSRITRPLRRRGLLAAGGTLLAGLAARKSLGGDGATGPAMQDLASLRPHPPTPLPPLSFTGGDGRPQTLDGWKGRGLVLNLWATWCVPCVAELPALDALARALAPSGRAVLAVSVDRGGADQVRAFFAAHAIRSLPVLLDPHSRLLAALRLDGIPTTLLVSAAGLEVARLQGALDWAQPAAAALVERLT